MTEDLPWMEDDEVTQRRDCLGKPMFLHRRKEESSHSRFLVTKGSSVGKGEAHIMIANGFFNIMDADIERVSFED